jgi:drug/metabolite transporter (DMT)-like permease
MSDTSNAIGLRTVTATRGALPPGLLLGSLGILGFSFSLPATRLAVADLDPWLVAFGRAAVAGVLAAVVLLVTGASRPTREQARRLLVVAVGVIVGFPLFTSLALDALPSARGAVVIAVLPAATAVFAVLRAGERPSPAFWVASGAGLAGVLGFVAFCGAGLGGGPQLGDAYLLAGVALCALGYAEGGALARELGGARTISWALVLSLPLTIPVTLVAVALTDLAAPPQAWAGFAYVSAFSMFLGFFAWYAGLARGGVARVGQVQLSQPLLSVLWAALVLGEHLSAAMLLAGAGVLASVVATQRARVAIMPARAGAVLHRGQRPVGHDDAAPDPRRGARRGDPAGVDVPHGLQPCAGEGRPG